MEGRIKGGKWGWLGWRREEWRQLYLNNNKKKLKKRNAKGSHAGRRKIISDVNLDLYKREEH